MSRYFTLAELIRSDTAMRLGIDNIPDDVVLTHLYELMFTLDSLREYVGVPIKVTSGYRCKLLNKAVGGVSTSIHQIGYAADLQPIGMKFDVFTHKVSEWCMTHKFDQVIIERNKSTSTRWVHFGLYDNEGKQRCRVFEMNVK